MRLTTELIPTPVVRRHLLDGRADAVITGPLHLDEAVYVPLVSSELVIVFSTAHFDPERLAQGTPTPNGGLLLPPEALAGAAILGVDPGNHVEQALLPYLAGLGIEAQLTCDYGDSMLGQSEMLRGTGGIIVEAGAAWRQFDREPMVLVPLPNEDAPRWTAGVSYLPSTKALATVQDFAAFAAKKIAELGKA